MQDRLILAEPLRAISYAPYYLAEARGAFTRQGIDLRMETAGTPTLAAEAVLEGRADLAWSGPMGVMQHRAADPASPLTAFCAVVMRDPFLIMGRRAREGLHLAELNGFRLGLVTEAPTPVWCLADAVARTGGRKVKDRAGGTMAENMASLLAGKLDAIQVCEPFASAVEEAGGAVWFSQSSIGPMAYSSLYGTTQTLAARRPAMRGMVRALAETLRWMETAPPGEIATLLEARFPDLPHATRERAVARYQAASLWTDGPHMPRTAFQALGEAMIRAGALSHIPDFGLCVDEAVVTEALA